MKALVTGGAGFIGSHIVEKLLAEGHSVVILDNFSSGKEENLLFTVRYPLFSSRYSLISGDIRNYATCLKACREVDVIFHQAALRSVPKSLTDPYQYNDVNINGTLTVLEAAKECSVKRVVFASSSSVYGSTDKFPQGEFDNPNPISPYALSKLAGEHYCKIFTEHFGVETVCLRYFNVYGPRQAPDDEYSAVIPKFIHNMFEGEQVPVYGTGHQSRDFTYIENVVSANILAAKATQVAGCVFNVANGKTHSILELINILNKNLGTRITAKVIPPRAGDIFRTLADVSNAERFLGYKPLIDFEGGLKRTVEYFRKQKKTECEV